jgi:dTDP-4-amino-4,6-dideoxygalactose transaminase
LRPELLHTTREQFIAALDERGISTSVHFIPAHLHTFYRETFGYRPGAFPRAERAYANLISLPFYTRMNEDDVDYVTEQILEVGRAAV